MTEQLFIDIAKLLILTLNNQYSNFMNKNKNTYFILNIYLNTIFEKKIFLMN